MAPALSETVRRNIAARAAWVGINQSELGRQLGLSRGSISERYRGVRPYTLDELQRVAELLGVEVAELIAEGWAPRGSNPQPTDYEHAELATVLAFPVERVA